MDIGFLNINKPKNCTSHDVVSKLRKSLEIKRIGHSGTLDPFAHGVLVIGINEATKLFEYIASDKKYLATITFGLETDTNDITGKILQTSKNIPSINDIKEKLKDFTGIIKQKPPIFSAIKINGNRAYSLARKNEITESDIEKKMVEIYSVELVSYELETCHGMSQQGTSQLRLKIHCSSGTYIRSLARDLGRALDTFAVLSELERIQIGDNFKIDESISIEAINKSNLLEHLIPPKSVIKLSSVSLSSEQIENISYGRSIKTNIHSENTSTMLLLDKQDGLVGIGNIVDNCIIQPKKVFIKHESFISKH